jgi:regulator of sigma E protease
VLTFLSLLVTLSVLILVHEFGHFFAAKSVGILAPRFSLGFGPRLWGFRVGETEFVLSAIPLGGYVKMAGMEDDEAATALEGGAPVEEVPFERTFDSKPLWARVWVISAGVIMNLLFAVFAFFCIAFFYGERMLPVTRLVPPPAAEATGPAAQLSRIPFGAKVIAVGERPVKTFEDIMAGLAQAPAGPVRLSLEGAQPVSLDLPSDPEARGTLLQAIRPLREPVIESVEPGSAAARAGLRPGDRVRAAGGRPVRTWEEFEKAIQGSPGKPLPLQVQRGATVLAVAATPAADSRKGDDGKTAQVGVLGVRSQNPWVHRDMGFGESVKAGFTNTGSTVVLIADALRKLVTGEISARNMGGLISIGEASGEYARLGLEAFLGFLALFSVNLAILNLLPIPILDGGHLMFLAIEAVRGRPLSVESRIRLSHVGLIIVVGLMLWANGNDVVRLVERYLAN